MQVRLVIFLVLALAITSAIGYHFWKVNDLNNEVSTLKLNLKTSEENNSELHTTINQQKASIERVEEQRQKEAEANVILRKEFKTSQANVNKLKKLLSEHDLNYLSLMKPGLIQNRINKGTDGVGSTLEEITQ